MQIIIWLLLIILFRPSQSLFQEDLKHKHAEQKRRYTVEEFEEQLRSNQHIKHKIKAPKELEGLITYEISNSSSTFENGNEIFLNKTLKNRKLAGTHEQLSDLGGDTCSTNLDSELWSQMIQYPQSPIYTGTAATDKAIIINDIDTVVDTREIYATGIYDNAYSTGITGYVPMFNIPTSYSGFSQVHCLFLYLDKYGAIQAQKIHYNSNSQYSSVCNAITYTPINEVLVAGHRVVDNGASAFYKYNLIVFRLDQQLNLLSYLEWTMGELSTVSSYATDIASTWDGGIFVTGSIYGWSESTTATADILIMRLNVVNTISTTNIVTQTNQLNVTWARGYGTAADDFAMSIQVTRNYDYIYIAGYQGTAGSYVSFFHKLNTFADTLIHIRTLTPAGSYSNFMVRKIMLTNLESFDAANSLLFCGSAISNGANQFFFGKLSSTLGIATLYRYGSQLSTGNLDVIGNCAQSYDQQYIIGSISTQKTQPSGQSLVNKSPANIIDPAPISADAGYTYPWDNTLNVKMYYAFEAITPSDTTGILANGASPVGFNEYGAPIFTSGADMQYVISTANAMDFMWACSCSDKYNNIQCQDSASDVSTYGTIQPAIGISTYQNAGFLTIYMQYMKAYMDTTYSWITCQYYWFDYTKIECNMEEPTSNGDFQPIEWPCTHYNCLDPAYTAYTATCTTLDPNGYTNFGGCYCYYIDNVYMADCAYAGWNIGSCVPFLWDCATCGPWNGEPCCASPPSDCGGVNICANTDTLTCGRGELCCRNDPCFSNDGLTGVINGVTYNLDFCNVCAGTSDQIRTSSCIDNYEWGPQTIAGTTYQGYVYLMNNYVAQMWTVAGTFTSNEQASGPCYGGYCFRKYFWLNYMVSQSINYGYLTSGATTGYYSIMNFMHCSQTLGNPQSAIDDPMEWWFEQDCIGNTAHYDTFIFKVQMDITLTTPYSNLPENAAYFGYFGDEIVTAIAVDHVGHIIVAATSTSLTTRSGQMYSDIYNDPPNNIGISGATPDATGPYATFSATTGTTLNTLLFKTHWDMVFECFEPTQTGTKTNILFDQRFIQPKYYQGTFNAIVFGTKLSTATGDYSTSVTIPNTYKTPWPALINNWADLWVQYYYITPGTTGSTSLTQTTNYGTMTFGDFGTVIGTSLQGFLTCKSYTYLDANNDVDITIGGTTTGAYTFNAALPYLCSTAQFFYIEAKVKSTSQWSGISIYPTSGSQVSKQSWYIEGSTASVPAEGIYYADLYWFFDYSLFQYDWDWYECRFPTSYENYYDGNVPSLNRFSNSHKLKIVINDDRIMPPKNRMPIPPVSVVAGQFWQFPFPTTTIFNATLWANPQTYFDSYYFEIVTMTSGYVTECTYLNARLNTVMFQYPSTQWSANTGLPEWMWFSEEHRQFTGYPPYIYFPAQAANTFPTGVSPTYEYTYTIDVLCYNAILEYATNTFTITPTNDFPTISAVYTIPNIVTQYDNYYTVGQQIGWHKTTNAQNLNNVGLTVGPTFTDTDIAASYLSLFTPYFSSSVIYQQTSHEVLIDFAALPSTHFLGDELYMLNTGANQIVKGLAGIQSTGQLFGVSVASSAVAIPLATPVLLYYSDDIGFSSWDSAGVTSALAGENVQQVTFYITYNDMPQPTATGLAYSFSNINPTPSPAETYFDSLFPMLDTYLGVADVDVVTGEGNWWTDANNALSTLSYQCTYSDGSTRPNWIAYDISSGEFKGTPQCSDSEYMNLKLTCYDTEQGSYSYYKTLLVSCPPQVTDAYLTIYGQVGMNLAFNFKPYFIQEYPTQVLTLSIPSTSDIAALSQYGMALYPQTWLLSGIPTAVTVQVFKQVTATDQFGSSVSVYFTLIITESNAPIIRAAMTLMQDQTITTGMRFFFCVPNYLFGDVVNGSPLVLYASNNIDKSLPSWLVFNPLNNCFQGIAPSPQTFQVQLDAMDIQYQTVSEQDFNIYVLQNNNPNVNLNYEPNDIYLTTGQSISYSVSLALFTDIEANQFQTINITGQRGTPLPSWLSYNQYNRTITGYNAPVGYWPLDICYTDDAGMTSYASFIIVVNQQQGSMMYSKLAVIALISLSSCIAIIVYLAFTVQVVMLMRNKKKMTRQHIKVKQAQTAVNRFDEFKEIDIKFVDKKYSKYIKKPAPVLMYDHAIHVRQPSMDPMNTLNNTTVYDNYEGGGYDDN